MELVIFKPLPSRTQLLFRFFNREQAILVLPCPSVQPPVHANSCVPGLVTETNSRVPGLVIETFLSATEYHSNADYDSRRVGVVIVVVFTDFTIWIIFLCSD